MMARITRKVMMVRIIPLAEVVTDEMRAVGRPLMMLQKMMSDMPLPIPRCVMTSPSHMMMMAPTTSTNTMMMFSRNSGMPMPEKLMP